MNEANKTVLTDAAKWLHAAYDRPPQIPETVDMLSRIDAAVLATQRPIANAAVLGADERQAFERFVECADDGEGYDVSKAMMQRLAQIGVVRRTHANYYETTEIGLSILAKPSAHPGYQGNGVVVGGKLVKPDEVSQQSAQPSAEAIHDFPNDVAHRYADLACDLTQLIRNVHEGICTIDVAVERANRNMKSVRDFQESVSKATPPTIYRSKDGGRVAAGHFKFSEVSLCWEEVERYTEGAIILYHFDGWPLAVVSGCKK